MTPLLNYTTDERKHSKNDIKIYLHQHIGHEVIVIFLQLKRGTVCKMHLHKFPLP